MMSADKKKIAYVTRFISVAYSDVFLVGGRIRDA